MIDCGRVKCDPGVRSALQEDTAGTPEARLAIVGAQHLRPRGASGQLVTVDVALAYLSSTHGERVYALDSGAYS